MSAASARYGVPCSMCGAAETEPCRSVKTRRVTDTHKARMDAYWRKVWRELAEEDPRR